MAKRRLRSGIIGTGFMGGVHTRAVRSIGGEVVAMAGRDLENAREGATDYDIPEALSVAELIHAPEVDVVHICAPNNQHVPLALAAIEAGKHVICEKPLAPSSSEASQLYAAAHQAGVVHAVPFVYRYYPVIREARARIAQGDDRLWLAHGHYLQDWLSDRNTFNWRVADPGSRAFADIGVHWCDLFEFVSGHRITELMADWSRLHMTRLNGGEEVAVTNEDGAVMIFRTDRGASGSVVISQASPGRKNRLWLNLDCESTSYSFDQENPDSLWIGSGTGVTLLPKGQETLGPEARKFVNVPSGHPQGYTDCFAMFMQDVYATAQGDQAGGMPSFGDGRRAALLTEALILSATSNQWVTVSNEQYEEIA